MESPISRSLSFSSDEVSVLRNTSTPGTITTSSFAASFGFSTGTGPFGISIGDLDGDGKPDVVATNFSTTTISVFRNTSTSGVINAGSFDTKVDFPTETSPAIVGIGDLDGDGKPDLAVTMLGSAAVSVYRNTSTSGAINSSSFSAKVDFTAGASVEGLAIGDLDGDGKPDLAVVNLGPDNVSVFRNLASSVPPPSPVSPVQNDADALVGANVTGTFDPSNPPRPHLWCTGP